MRNNNKTLHLSLIVTLFLTFILSTNVFAASSSNIELVKTSDKSYIIYAENIEDTFRYSITDNNTEDPKEYDVSSLDANGNNVAILDLSGGSTSEDMYLWIKDKSNNITATKIDLNDYIDYEKLASMNSITKRISVETGDTKLTKTDDQNITKTVTVGKTVITDDSSKTYEYSLSKLESSEAAKTLDTLITLVNSFDESTDMYTVVSTYKQINELYVELYNSAEFKPVENMEVLQPEEAKNGEKYVLLLRKLDGGTEITSDIQILTSIRKFDKGIDELVTKEKVKKAVKLPVTGDNIFLIIGFITLVLALIVVLILKVKHDEKENV